jgi:flavodoxin
MKRVISCLILLLVVSTVETISAQKMDFSGKRILVAYFSRVGISAFTDTVDVVSSASLQRGDDGLVGNTEVVANNIHDIVGGDIVQIKTVKQYPESYRDTATVAREEQRSNERPELTTQITTIRSYDVIFLGYPNWWGTLPMALFTFLEKNLGFK